ncbi:hypothetical protein [Chitinivorax sp. B]|uniref:hypothetical protein n=1 Tax=Chitinivorax sp. B TaxID=2502235 RepID=UPI0010F9846B|nr:hypothetical protein [Chitinivorax sp. B]
MTNKNKSDRYSKWGLPPLCLLAAGVWVSYLIAPPEPAPPAPVIPPQAATPTAANNDLQFNPDSCKPGHGEFVHVALGRTVLRIPYQTQLTLTGYHKEDPERAQLPASPDPAEPEGCYGNPTRVLFMHYPIAELTIPASDTQPERTVGPGSFELITNMGDAYHSQKGHEEMFEMGKANKNGIYDCTPHTPDLIGCIPRPNPTAGDYQALPERYQAPAQRPFTISCIDSNWRCSVVYRAVGDINIGYVFGFRQLPLEHVVAFDKQARAHIEQLVVPDYTWTAVPATKQPSSNHTVNK